MEPLARSRRVARLAAAAFAAGLLATPGGGRAEGFTGTIEPAYSRVTTETSSPTAPDTRVTADQLVQRYRLAFDRTFSPELRLATGGVLEDQRSWTTDGYGRATLSRYFANLNVGNPILGGALGYDRNRQDTLRAPALIGDTYRLSLGWRPEGLPRLDLIATRTDRYDSGRVGQDRTVNSAILSATFAPTRELELRYSVRYVNPIDHLRRTEQTTLGQTARIAYSDSLLARRLNLSATYTIDTEYTESTARRAGGVIENRLRPLVGLSAIDAPPATVERVELERNPGLLDGNLGAATVPPLNLGFSRSLAGDTGLRQMGLELADRLTPVNTLRVSVDVLLPPDIAGVLTWTVYQSEDNLVWTPVPIARPVQFDPLAGRFEITIPETRAQFLKVATRPLPAGLTTEQRFADVFVTELEAFEILAVPIGTRELSRLTGQLSAAGNYRILAIPSLVYDSSLLVGHTEDLSQRTYRLVNGLSLSHRFNPILAGAARVDRTDADPGGGAESSYGAQASLTASPLPTLGASLAWSSRFAERGGATSNVNSVSALARAALYQGLDLSSTASFSFGRSFAGVDSTTTNLSVASSLEPHPRLSLNAGYAYSRSDVGGAVNVIQLLTLAGTSNPVGSVNLSAGITRYLVEPANTAANFALGWSPLAGGAVQLGFSYTRSLETASDAVSQLGAASVRWNIRPRTFLETVYTVTDADTPGLESASSAFTARLSIGI